MPLVRIDVVGRDGERLEALGRAVHEALMEAMGFPENDLFQVLTGHDGRDGGGMRYGDYLGVRRDEGVVFIGITLRSGRPDGQKRALYRRIAELAEEYAGVEPRNVVVTLTENASADWSFGYGVAQYAKEA